MTDPLPAPLTPAGVDLSGLGYMPLMIADLVRSDAWRLARRRPELGFYLVNLWLAAFWGKPAGSLPDDDDALADLAKCPLDRWPDMKEGTLRGFVRCADGRWYHRYLCQQVIPVALERRLRWRERKQRQRLSGTDARTTGVPAGQDHDLAADDTTSRGTSRGVPRDSPLRDGTGRDREEESTASAARPPGPDLLDPFDRDDSNGSATGSISNGIGGGSRASTSDGRTDRGTRLAADWRPSADDRAFAGRCGLEPDSLAAEFRDYWHGVPGARGRKLDWAATFRNRCRAIAGGAGRGRAAGVERAGSAAGASGIAGAAARVIARRGLA